MTDRNLLIDGDWLDTDERRDVTNPYNGDVVGSVAQAGEAEAARAMEVAAAALADGPPPQHERAESLETARRMVLDAEDGLARTIALEAGKPMGAARTEVQRCANTLLWGAIEARRLAGDVIPMDGTEAAAGKMGLTVLRPRGVVAAISPFNFPLNLVCHKVAPALAAGCPVVLKPAGDTPLTAYAFAEILLEAGVPGNRLQVLTGPSSVIGPIITGHDAVEVITFTGSSEVGYALAEANPRAHVLLELGSNTPVIVDETADLQTAASKIAATGYGFAGQSCISPQRIYVVDAVAEEFIDLLVDATEALVVGDPLDEDTAVGPLIRAEDRDRVRDWVTEAVDGGATIRTGGDVNDDGTLQPTILTDVEPDMKVCAEEVFGPVLAVQAVADLDEGIRLANDTKYGLQAGLFTGSLDAGLRAAHELVFGGVTINEAPAFRADQQPYGGVRESGNTREGPPWAIHDYVDQTTVMFQRPT